MTTQLSDECKSRLYRLILTRPVEGVAFVMADSREAASRMARTVVAVLRGVGIHEVALKDVHSFSELVRTGTSEDADLRVFEIAHSSEWTNAPYFLTDDSSLLGKWAELRADIAASEARAVIRRTK